MKKALLLFSILILLVSCSEFQKSDKPVHAYIVTVGIDYENVASRSNKPSFYFTSLGNPSNTEFRDQSSISSLSCCVNDADDIVSLFSQVYEQKGIQTTVFNLNSQTETPALFPTVQNLKSVINSIKPNKDDLVLFYYSGHGIFDNEKKSSFFCMGDNVVDANGRASNVYLLPVTDVLSALKEKGCRVLAIFDDCETGADYFNDKSNLKSFDFSNISVIASSSQEETSSAGTYNSRFTDMMLSLLGWDCMEDKLVSDPPSCTASQLVRALQRAFSGYYQTPEINFTYTDTVVIP